MLAERIRKLLWLAESLFISLFAPACKFRDPHDAISRMGGSTPTDQTLRPSLHLLSVVLGKIEFMTTKSGCSAHGLVSPSLAIFFIL